MSVVVVASAAAVAASAAASDRSPWSMVMATALRKNRPCGGGGVKQEAAARGVGIKGRSAQASAVRTEPAYGPSAQRAGPGAATNTAIWKQHLKHLKHLKQRRLESERGEGARASEHGGNWDLA